MKSTLGVGECFSACPFWMWAASKTEGSKTSARRLAASLALWLADWKDFEDYNSVWNEWVDRQIPPVRVCVQASLWRPNILVEIMVTAAQTQALESRSGAHFYQ